MNKTIFNLFAALAFIFAALATPSALAYKVVAVVYSSLGAAIRPAFEGTGETQSMAIAQALAECQATTGISDECPEASAVNIFLSGSTETPACVAIARRGDANADINDNVYAFHFNDNTLSDLDLRTMGNAACEEHFGTGAVCVNSGISVVGQRTVVGSESFICDTEGLICGDETIRDEINGECLACPPTTHEILNGICVEACTANQILVDRACQTCEDDQTANKALQRCEEICSENQIRNPADTATCFTCAPNQLVNTEANNGNGSCDACPTDSHVLIDIGGEETCIMREICDADSLPTPQGTCNQCSAGYTANAEKDECVCVDNSITDVGGNCMPCLAAVAPIADKEKNECVAATTQAECQSNFVATPIMEGGLCIAIASSLHCDLVDSTQPILDNGSCRAADSRDCPADKPVYDGGNCRIRLARDCGNGETFQNGNCIAPEQDTVNNRAIVIGLIMVGAFVADSWSDDAKSELNWTPSYAFRNNNGNVSYSVGSRWTAKTENFGYYWQTAKTGGGDYRYGSGMSYTNNIFAANINSEGTREDTDVNLSITAQKRMGQWNLGGGYRIDTRLTPTESKTRNRLNLTARYTIERWILSATANTTGKDSSARVDYSYRF